MHAFKHQAEACKRHDASHLLDKIKAPTLVMVGSEDVITKVEASRELVGSISGATLKIIPSTGHMLQIEQSNLFLKSLEEFLQPVKSSLMTQGKYKLESTKNCSQSNLKSEPNDQTPTIQSKL